jgi:uncharacterized protein
MTTLAAPGRAPVMTGPADRRVRMRDVVFAAVAVAGGAMAFLVGIDGSPLWRVLRVAAAVAVAGAAGYAVRREPGWLRAPVAFTAGLVATAAGAGIGLPHLSKAGWSPRALAGVVALVAGVFLLGAGAAGAVRSARRWWRLLVVPAVLALTYLSLWAGIQAVAATNVPRTQVRSTTPADRGLSYQGALFVTSDGVRLSGWYVPSTNRAAVVLLHGAGSTRSDVLDQAVVLARHGYGVLLFDARGHGDSGGRAMDFGWYGDRDVAAAVSYLQTRPDVDGRRIAAVGMSMGGEQAIGAAAGDPRIRAVVAEGATNRVAADRAFLPRVYGVRGWIQQRIDALTYALADLLTAADPPIALRAAVASTAPRPVLLIAGGAVPDEAHAARDMRRGNANAQVWEVPGAGHTRALSTRPGEWEQRVSAFLDAALAAPAA